MPETPPFLVGYRHQREWGVRGRNLLIMLALYFGGIGCGLYLTSLWAGYPRGALIGLIIVGGKVISHILFLGRPERFWRAIARPQSSWLSRGLIFLTIFILSGLGYLLPDNPLFPWLPWSATDGFGQLLYWASLVSAFLVLTYSGLLFNRTAIPFWRDSTLPFLLAAISLFSGASLAGFFLRLFPDPAADEALVSSLALWAAVGFLALLAIYLWNAYHNNLASQRSVRYLALSRESAWYFYVLFLALGLSFPLVVAITDFLAGIDGNLVATARLVEVLVGALLFRYLIYRGGIYLPLVI